MGLRRLARSIEQSLEGKQVDVIFPLRTLSSAWLATRMRVVNSVDAVLSCIVHF